MSHFEAIATHIYPFYCPDLQQRLYMCGTGRRMICQPARNKTFMFQLFNVIVCMRNIVSKGQSVNLLFSQFQRGWNVKFLCIKQSVIIIKMMTVRSRKQPVWHILKYTEYTYTHIHTCIIYFYLHFGYLSAAKLRYLRVLLQCRLFSHLPKRFYETQDWLMWAASVVGSTKRNVPRSDRLRRLIWVNPPLMWTTNCSCMKLNETRLQHQDWKTNISLWLLRSERGGVKSKNCFTSKYKNDSNPRTK